MHLFLFPFFNVGDGIHVHVENHYFVCFHILLKGCARANDRHHRFVYKLNVDRTSFCDEQLLCAFEK